jgi:hypothetical protein
MCNYFLDALTFNVVTRAFWKTISTNNAVEKTEEAKKPLLHVT